MADLICNCTDVMDIMECEFCGDQTCYECRMTYFNRYLTAEDDDELVDIWGPVICDKCCNEAVK